MEVVAKAATEEINRRVADSCAVIRLELSRSQRDIDSLKRKCQVMENELRKVRGRGRRKVFICSSSEKLPFQSVCARETGVNACRVEQPVPPTREEPEASTQHVHQTIQILEDRSAAATVIKEEGSENDSWRRREGQFPYEHHGNKPLTPAQEISEESNQFTEDIERQRAHLTHTCSPSTSNEERPGSLRLQVKAEKEEDEEKEVAEVILVEESEQRKEETNRLQFAYNDTSNEAERTESFTSTQFPCDLPVFSQPVETAIEQSGNEAKTIQNDQIELYGVAQVSSVHEQPQPAWCRDRAHEADHIVQRQRHEGSSTHQEHRALSRPGNAGGRASMISQPGSNIPHQTFLGRGRGGLRRFRAHRLASVMAVLAQSAVAEISKVYDDGLLLLRLEVCRKDSEIQTLKGKLETVENELRLLKESQSSASRGVTASLTPDPCARTPDLTEITDETEQHLSWKYHPVADACNEKEKEHPGEINHKSTTERNSQDILTKETSHTPTEPEQSPEDLNQAASRTEFQEETEQAIRTLDENSVECVVIEDSETQPWSCLENGVEHAEEPDCSVVTEQDGHLLISSVWSVGSSTSSPVGDATTANRFDVDEARQQRMPQQTRSEEGPTDLNPSRQ
ncbi:zinc finger protein, partial [Clarias magur]